MNENQNINQSVATTTDEINTSDWQTYRNEEYGYKIKYPKEWKVSETDYYQEHFEKRVKYVSFNDNEYYLIFLLNKINEDFNTGRTGIGAGDFKNTETYNIEGINVKIKNLVYENKIKEMFFSGRNDLYNLSGHFSYLGDAYRDDFNFNKIKLNIAKSVIKSFKFIDVKK